MANILIVDDEPDMAEMLELQLVPDGHQVTICNDGEEGIHSLTSNQFDLVILDLFMPKKNGLEVALFIRDELPEGKSSVPIIAITGGNGVLKAEKSSKKIEHFVNATLRKPLDYKALYEKITEFIAA